jgi:hypothetical protein
MGGQISLREHLQTEQVVILTRFDYNHSLLGSYSSCMGRVAQLGEHLLCNHAEPLQPFHSVP